jgi:pimeloyl-ACP methyl ester carboxylesterase
VQSDQLAASAAVLLPGTGSDADFVHRAFAPALAGMRVIAVEPTPHDLIAGYERALAAAADRYGRIIVGGVSIGAAVSLAWAARHPGAAAGALAALPAWIGRPGDAPAAASARHTAAVLRAQGLESTVAAMRAGSPGWLADELERSWRAQWPELPTAMEAAAEYASLTEAELGALRLPVGLAAAIDDPIHPLAAAQRWQSLLPRCALRTLPLAALGDDPANLGRACLAALLAAR